MRYPTQRQIDLLAAAEARAGTRIADTYTYLSARSGRAQLKGDLHDAYSYDEVRDLIRSTRATCQ